MHNRSNATLSRRDFLKLAGVGTGAVLLNGCAAPLVRPTPTPVPSATSVPSKTPTPTRTRRPLGTPTPTVPYTARKLCFVLWDHQLPLYRYKPRNLNSPVPETCPLYSGAVNPVTPAWEAYWRGILHLCNPNVGEVEFERSWQSLVASNRAFTNGTGPSSKKFALHSLTCGGATHEMVTGVSNGQHMEIYTLNSRKDPPPIPANPEDIDITRHFFATSGSNVRLPDAGYGVYGFPQFENCIVPLVSPADTDMIDLSRIKVVTDIQRPFNP